MAWNLSLSPTQNPHTGSQFKDHNSAVSASTLSQYETLDLGRLNEGLLSLTFVPGYYDIFITFPAFPFKGMGIRECGLKSGRESLLSLL